MHSHDSKVKMHKEFTEPLSLEATDIISFCVYGYANTNNYLELLLLPSLL